MSKIEKILDCVHTYISSFFSDNSPIIFQAGAHMGEICIDKFRKFYPDSTIYSFEPCQKSYEHTLKRMKDENISNINLYNFGLSDKDGQGILRISESSNTNSMHEINEIFGHFTARQTQNREQIVLRSLDSFCSEKKIGKIDLLYLNVESHELHVLSGAQDILKNTTSVLLELNMIPIWKGATFPDIDNFLKKMGFYFSMNIQRKDIPCTSLQDFALYLNNSTLPKITSLG
jgi:FkbM family methyltransferase